MLTSIIIPTYNGLGLLRETIASIRRHTQSPYELIVVDNGSKDGTLEYLLRYDITFVSLPGNIGFPAACNVGLRLSRGERLLLLNNDVLVTKGWLDRLLACLHHAADIGIVGPMSNYVSGKQQISMPGSYEAKAEQLALENAGSYENVDRVVGLCFLFKRELMNTIGLLDEQFSPGHFEDDDYCYRARKNGYKVMIARDAFIFHHGSASFSREGEEAVKRLIAGNREKFIAKWGVDPHQFI